MQRVALSAMLACGLALALASLPALASNGQGKALSEDKVADVCKLSALLKKMSLEAKKLGVWRHWPRASRQARRRKTCT
ncbi:hypothetical protein ERJ75_001715300 [Trypanosoma vivax]|nr:hypothetical protein ERJ75_001715300 [Trypanosoma vivax]